MTVLSSTWESPNLGKAGLDTERGPRANQSALDDRLGKKYISKCLNLWSETTKFNHFLAEGNSAGIA